jgi:hypothetical protein
MPSRQWLPGASENPDKVLLRNYLSAGPVLIFAVGLMVAVVAGGVEVIWNKVRGGGG